MLEATTNASNAIAFDAALLAYKDSMENYCREHRPEKEIVQHHRETRVAALVRFDEVCQWPETILSSRHDFQGP